MTRKETFIDFLGEIIDCVVNTKGQKADPYDISLNNHYTSLYDTEKMLKKEKIDIPVNKIIQDKKSRTITVETSMDISKDDKQILEDIFEERNIDYNISKGKLKSFTVEKKSKGVLEEREWKK